MIEHFNNSSFVAEMAKGTTGTNDNAKVLWIFIGAVAVIGTISIITYAQVKKYKIANKELIVENEKLKRSELLATI